MAYTGNNGTRSSHRPKERNCNYCNAPNWSPHDKSPAGESKCHNCKKEGQFTKNSRFEQRRPQENRKKCGNGRKRKKLIPTNPYT